MSAQNSKVSGSARCTNFHSWKTFGLARWKGNLNRISCCVAEQTEALHFICGQANVLAANLTRNHKQAKISLTSCLALIHTYCPIYNYYMASGSKGYTQINTIKLYYLCKNANTTGKDSNIAGLSCWWLFVDSVCSDEQREATDPEPIQALVIPQTPESLRWKWTKPTDIR